MHSVICSGLGSLEYFVIIKCTKFGQLILRKIVKIVATRCYILRLKCTKFDFGCGFAPEGAPRDPLAGFKGPLLSGGRRREGKGRGRGSGKEKGKGREGESGREAKAFPLL